MAKDKINKKKVLIDLSDSTYAHSFVEQNRIHQVEFEAAVNLVVNQINRIGKDKTSEKHVINRVHNTISIFGDRGTGKTSFIRSLFDEIEKRCKRKDEVIAGRSFVIVLWVSEVLVCSLATRIMLKDQ